MNGSRAKLLRKAAKDKLDGRDTTIQTNKYGKLPNGMIISNFGRRFYQRIKREN